MSDNKQSFCQQQNQVQHDAQLLPEPDAYSQKISHDLQKAIRQAINENGDLISFEHFMHMALYQPGMGYYAAGSRKFGVDGDFITAPEVSPLFSYCLANFCQQVLEHTPDGDILEFGAGSGVMAADILAELERLHALPNRYFILEVSADLQQRQQQLLKEKVPHLFDRVEWLQQLPDAEFNGVILANELLDAMPVQRFYVDGGEVKQYAVTWSDEAGQFETCTTPASKEVDAQVEHVQQYLGKRFADKYESEVSIAHAQWLESVQSTLGQAVLLLIDYGYGRSEFYHPDRSMGTLMCHYRHRAHPDPFKLIGLQDITAYVDFTTLAEAAVNNNMDVLGYTSQAAFLLDCGLEKMAPDSEKLSTQETLQFAQQVKSLTLPGEMGERFKVMAIGKNYNASVKGFGLFDQLRCL